MDQLTKGANAPLSASRVTLTVDVPAPADISALLVTESGKVRSDADFVFYNQPTGPGVRCLQPSAGQPWRVEVDLAAVPADVHAVRVVTSLDDTGATFGRVGQPVARVADDAGTPLVAFAMTDLSTESIVVAIELYRRAGAWKVRAVGQGYAGGLADLITDHGVSVDDAPAPAPAVAPPAPAAAVPPPPAPPAPSERPARSWGPPPAQTTPPVDAPPAPPAPTYARPETGTGTASGGEVQLTKARPVSLTKGQKVTLTKDGGVALTMIRMGLGWDPVKKRGMFGSREVEIDLDASAILFAGSDPVDVAFYNQLRTRDGSVQHMGDNRTGEGEGDDETILIDLTRVPVHVTSVMLVVTSYQGQTFEQVQNAFCRLVDHTTGVELARYTLAGGMAFTGMLMARVYRQGSTWKLQAAGEGMQARTPTDSIPSLLRHLG
ncbi:TerD family protein [Cellulomonas cellasea]|uniref:Stress response protein SCP2 n=1 Tax=Cellulomonas cellasea TaxID=43670 RepID=A0A7W4YC17_9CELL|nr:TerD family protein [Cellulomonas cellasea]MBB2923242.1 stress response protein SCP2 [Cellulomonas cellasea]